MFKRVLVLVLFLFGVFWWLTNRDSEPKEPTTETEVVTVETETEEGKGEEDEDETEIAEKEDGEATTESEEKETKPASDVEVSTTPGTTTPQTTAPVSTEPATTPATTTPTVAPTRPTVVAPTVPAKTTDIKVYLYEWGLDLSDKTIPAGTVNFQVQNDGRFTHDFSVSGFGNLGKVTPNEKKTFTVKLGAGEYEAFSKRRQDYERGLKEDFTVVQ